MKTPILIGFPNVARMLIAAALVISGMAMALTAQSIDSHPANPVRDLTLEQLGNLEVTTVSKTPEEVWNTPAAIFVITHDAIVRSGATNIPDTLRLAPGVEVAQIDSNKWSIGIRGFGSRLCRNVLVLIDGRTVYNTLLAGTYWEAQNVVLEDVDRIEVIRGPGGTIWGPNAVNGVINIITKSTRETQGTLVSVTGGSQDLGEFTVRYGGENKNLAYRGYAMGFDRGPEYHPDGRNFDSWRTVQGGFRVDWQRTARDNFTFQGDLYDEGAGESVVATSYTQPYSQVIDGTAYLSGGNLLARWERKQGEGSDFQLEAYYDRTNRREPNFADLRDTYDIDMLDKFLLPGRQQISWGLGARASRGDNPTVVSGLTFAPQQRTDTLYTAFFQDDIGIIQKRLALSLGTKLLRTNFTGVQLQPSVRLLWTPTSTETIWAAFTHALRTPSSAERNFSLSGFIGVEPDGTPFFARFDPNPDFTSEQLNGYELGYRRLLRRKLYLDVAAFYNHYTDLFSEDIVGAPFVENDPPPTHLLLPAEFGNGLLGNTRGIEIAPEWRPFPFWRLSGTYSYLKMSLERSRDSLDVGTAPIIDGSSPENQATAESDLNFKKLFSFSLIYRYVGALPSENIDSYSTADARFSYKMGQHFQWSVVGQNLLQPYIFEASGDPGAPVGIKRSIYGQLTWKN